MSSPRFVQIHTLCSYPAVLLNRDDAGLAKRLPYGGASRIRVSSQCLKRHWRVADDEWGLKNITELKQQDFGIRSRRIFSERIAGSLINEGFDASSVNEIVGTLRDRIFKKSGKDGGGKDNDDSVSGSKGRKGGKAANDVDSLQFDQAFLLGQQEIEYLINLCREILAGDRDLRKALEEKPKNKESLTDIQKKMRSDLKENIQTLGAGARLPRSLEAALFGRMVTSDIIANVDAAIHVAHAFTVHAEESESDYFTVVDDLPGEAGTAGIFETELTSGLFYGYVVVDVGALVANVGDDRALAGRVVEHLLHLIATVSPGAKKGSTAPYAYADLMLVETGRRQPRSLAGAFRAPVPLASDDLLGAALAALRAHLESIDAAYGAREARAALCTAPIDLPGVSLRACLDDVAAWAGAAVRAEAA